MPGRTDSRPRMVAILLIFAILATAATAGLGYWQVVAAPELTAKAIRSMTPPQETRLARASIVDRNGKVLAQTASLDRLDAHPSNIDPESREVIVDTLTPILGLDAGQREEYLAKLSSGKAWTWLRTRLTQKQSALVRIAMDDRKLPGLVLEPIDVRAYPRQGGQSGTTLASHLVGFVAGDDRGAYGVEALYDDRLTGADGGSVDIASLAGVDLGLDDVETPPLAMTIDWKLQRQLEKELSTARITTGAKSVNAIVIDPHTGEIVASASVPGYDANNYAEVASDHMGLLRDPNVSEVFEPGSVLKIFTATAALEKGVVTPQTKIKDVPLIEFYQYKVHNSDKKGEGLISVKDVIAMSRNVAIAKIARRLAPNSTQRAAHHLYDMWDKVGIVGTTGVDIASEESGLFCDPGECLWAPVDLANRAFGQGVAVTLMQLATGFSTLVNGGYRVQPHVVLEGDAAQVPKQRVLSPKVARQAQEILVHVTGSRSHYAAGSLIPGYMIGGKTGTAQIWDSKRGQWKDNIFNHNFVGFVGSNKPEYVIAVRIEEPENTVFGQGHIEIKIESYELFRNIAKGVIKHMDIRRSKDPAAGRPIIGTDAARYLTPDRNRAGLRKARQRKQPADAAELTQDEETAAKAGAAKRGGRRARERAGRSQATGDVDPGSSSGDDT